MELLQQAKGLVSRVLPQAQADNQVDTIRLSRFQEVYGIPIVRKQHVLADEGSYFVTNNGQAAITAQVLQQNATSIDPTKPTLAIFNSDSDGNAAAKRIFLDYVHLLAGGTAYSVGAAAVQVAMLLTIIIDAQGGASGGTDLTPNIICPNIDVGKKSSQAVVRFGALTAPALSANSRQVVGARLFRMCLSQGASANLSVANLDFWHMNFGGVEPNMALPNPGSPTIATSMWGSNMCLPPVILGPGDSMWMYISVNASAGTVVAGNLIPEIGWWER